MKIWSTNCVYAISEEVAKRAFVKQFPELIVVGVECLGERSDPVLAQQLGIMPTDNPWAPRIYAVTFVVEEEDPWASKSGQSESVAEPKSSVASLPATRPPLPRVVR